MGGKNGKHKGDGKSSGWLDVVTGTKGKIVGTLAIVGGLLTQIEHIIDGAKKIPEIWKTVATVTAGSPTDCFTPEMHVRPVDTRYKEWRRVEFQLTGQNRCPQSLQVHVAYKTQSESLRIEPTIDKASDQIACSGYDKPDCWQSGSVDARQKVDWKLMPPKLIKLGELKSGVPVPINWMVFDSKAGQQIWSGTQPVTVKDDQ